ncbi:DUF4435 domain-containing protein [Thalassospira sp. MCCC 1A03138]|uniref:DUF4435 domain-containing protein n=1 Tax=Thalassospira sp. MCCC 1A03138 TaxID=1470576 RepID=UPI000A1E0735|nr:DUF4435 domain-containing protein [Thalassospira sp. MCCC 1A03138]OSQ29410.1 hypothetical protein TH468_14780 [Thalassospira sp. MCCC 1A03138]
MNSGKVTPTVDELFELLKRTSLPTVLVEGKDDIIFYRSVEHELKFYNVDMLPAGNKHSVLKLFDKLSGIQTSAPIVFLVDKDLWVHATRDSWGVSDEIITTNGYSIENDLFSDGDLEALMEPDEKIRFNSELSKFVRWYALAVSRSLSGKESAFRTNPGKVLDDDDFYDEEMRLLEDETYPEDLFNEIMEEYHFFLRGKSLLSLVCRQLSSRRRKVKFGSKQLIAFGASRKGDNFERICVLLTDSLKR